MCDSTVQKKLAHLTKKKKDILITPTLTTRDWSDVETNREYYCAAVLHSN